MEILKSRSKMESVLRTGTMAEEQQYWVIKRTIDIAFSLLGLAILLPLLILIGLAVKLEDPQGAILFRQTRIGKNGKPFNIYKFRSMVVGAEQMLDQLLPRNEVSGAMFKMEHDPRATRIGKLIRTTSLDELPQLWNVLRGDMSLVGPRPPLPREILEYTPYEMGRLSILPGCTGLWQISGRNKLGFKEMVELDLQYIARRSLWMDVKIIWKTIIMMLVVKNGC